MNTLTFDGSTPYAIADYVSIAPELLLDECSDTFRVALGTPQDQHFYKPLFDALDMAYLKNTHLHNVEIVVNTTRLVMPTVKLTRYENNYGRYYELEIPIEKERN